MYSGRFKPQKVENEYGVFDSKSEYERYLLLLDMERNGLITDLKRQVTYELLPQQTKVVRKQLKTKISGQNKTIVFPEGEDVRIQGAAVRLAADGLLKPILLGDSKAIAATATANNFDLSGVEVIDPANYNETALS